MPQENKITYKTIEAPIVTETPAGIRIEYPGLCVVHVHRSDDGVSADIYNLAEDYVIAETYAMNDELAEEDED